MQAINRLSFFKKTTSEITNDSKKSSNYIIIKSVPIFHWSVITAYVSECMGEELLQSISQKETPNSPWYPGALPWSLKKFKTNLEKVSAIKLPEGSNYVSISSFLKESKKNLKKKKLKLSKLYLWVELMKMLLGALYIRKLCGEIIGEESWCVPYHLYAYNNTVHLKPYLKSLQCQSIMQNY